MNARERRIVEPQRARSISADGHGVVAERQPATGRWPARHEQLIARGRHRCGIDHHRAVGAADAQGVAVAQFQDPDRVVRPRGHATALHLRNPAATWRLPKAGLDPEVDELGDRCALVPVECTVDRLTVAAGGRADPNPKQALSLGHAFPIIVRPLLSVHRVSLLGTCRLMPPVPLILPPGSQLGDYTIDDVLGVGGMATVYRARQHSLDRLVALKVLNPRLAADTTFRARFQREGALIAALDHPHVIPVYDSGEISGRLYLAMRLVDGETLADVLADGALDAREALQLLEPIASALDAAHVAGLTHRDIKPQNILVERGGRVFLADFGVARAAGGPELTAAGGFLGSVSYVAPEQILGGQVGPATDVYAFAVVVHECLTGRTPFRRDTEAGVIQAHLDEAPAPFGPADDPTAAAAFQVVARGLAKRPEDRPARAGELVAGLRAVLDAAPPTVRERKPAFGVLPAGTRRRLIVDPVPPPPDGPPAPRRSNLTVHDSRRPELEPDEEPGGITRRAVIALVAIVLVAIAVPAFLALRSEPAGAPTAVGPVEILVPEGWTSRARPNTEITAGLSPQGGRQFLQNDGRGTLTIASLKARTRLAPLNFGEQATLVSIAGGTARRWESKIDGDPQWIAITAGKGGPIAVHCERPDQRAADACDAALASLDAKDGELGGDPVPEVADVIAEALATSGRARSRTQLPALDRGARAQRADRLAANYRRAARPVATLRKSRPWDREVHELSAALSDSAEAYEQLARAARRRDRTADGKARTKLRGADADVERALERLGRRGYRVD